MDHLNPVSTTVGFPLILTPCIFSTWNPSNAIFKLRKACSGNSEQRFDFSVDVGGPIRLKKGSQTQQHGDLEHKPLSASEGACCAAVGCPHED